MKASVTTKIGQLKKKYRQSFSQKDKQLVTLTVEIDQVNLEKIYKSLAGQYSFTSFWKNINDGETIICFGVVAEFSDEQSNLQNIESKWRQLTAEAIEQSDNKQGGSGLLLFGGLPFDARNNHEQEWKDFQSASFVLPEIIVTKKDRRTFVTCNQYVESEKSIEKLYNQFTKIFTEEKHHTYKQNELKSVRNKTSKVEWTHLIEEAKQSIRTTALEKVVLARQLELTYMRAIDDLHVLSVLEQATPSGYIFHFKRNKSVFLGATPERLVRVDDRHVLSTCLAGTAPRGATAEIDERIKNDLLTDSKNLMEHAYVVQMIQKALKPYCTEIDLSTKPTVLTLPQLRHLYTPVTAKLCESKSICDLVRSLHPTPALGGTPKELSVQYIREKEQMDRGWYGAPIGWFDAQMNGEFAVAIRSALIKEKVVSLYAGAGIVKDSCADAEYEETSVKLSSMLKALGGTIYDMP